MGTSYGMALPEGGPTCPRHPETVTYVTCQRCARPTCPACQVPAAVGVHCVDCANQARREYATAVRRSHTGISHPYVTFGLTGLICAMYLVQLIVPRTTNALALVPQLGLQEPWRLLTNALVHDTATPLHLIGNALLLVLLGRIVESALGHVGYGIMCWLSVLGGAAAVLWTTSPPSASYNDLDWLRPVIGISTVGYGLMTALLVLELRRHGDVRGAMTLLLLNVGFSLVVSNVSWQGHLGGALAGLAVSWALTRGDGAGSAISRRRLVWVGSVGTAVMVIAILGRYALIPVFWGGLGG